MRTEMDRLARLREGDADLEAALSSAHGYLRQLAVKERSWFIYLLIIRSFGGRAAAERETVLSARQAQVDVAAALLPARGGAALAKAALVDVTGAGAGCPDEVRHAQHAHFSRAWLLP